MIVKAFQALRVDERSTLDRVGADESMDQSLVQQCIWVMEIKGCEEGRMRRGGQRAKRRPEEKGPGS